MQTPGDCNQACVQVKISKVTAVWLTSCRNSDARAKLAPVVCRPPDQAILLGPAHRSCSSHQTHHAACAGGLGGIPAVAAGADVLISSCLARRHCQVCKSTSLYSVCVLLWLLVMLTPKGVVISLLILFSRHQTTERRLCCWALHKHTVSWLVGWSVRHI